MADLDANLDERMAHLAGVVSAVHDEGRAIAARAEAVLSAHHETGDHEIELETTRTDAIVSLTGTNAVSLEYGHHNVLTGEFTEGLFILTSAADL